MFKSKLAETKILLGESIRAILRGYCLTRYNRTDVTELFKQNTYQDDPFLLHLGEQNMFLETKNPPVIDFQMDMLTILQALDNDEKFADFTATVTDDLLHGEELALPFKDFILCVGDIQTYNWPEQNGVLIRVTDITKEWNVDWAKVQYGKVVEIAMYSLQGKAEPDGRRYYAPSITPVQLFIQKDGERHHQLIHFDKKIEKFLYPNQDHNSAIDWAKSHAAMCMFVVGSFMFMYKHQRINYDVVEPPEGLQKRRRKRNKNPYERYFVSKLGDYTGTIYSEPKESDGKREGGVALHIRRGHWRLKRNHRKLPVDKQERIFIQATVAGNPLYGIIIRDYESDMMHGQEVTPEKMKTVLSGMHRALQDD